MAKVNWGKLLGPTEDERAEGEEPEEIRLIAEVYKRANEMERFIEGSMSLIERVTHGLTTHRCHLNEALEQLEKYVEMLPIEPARYRRKKPSSSKSKLHLVGTRSTGVKCILAFPGWGLFVLLLLL